MFAHNPQKVVIPPNLGLQPARAMPYCIRKDMSSHAMSDLEPGISSPALLQEKGSRARQGWDEPSPQTLVFDHIVSPDRPHHPQPWQRGCSIMLCWSSSRERTRRRPGPGARLWPAGQRLEPGWDSGTNLILTVLELNQKYLGLGRRCP